MKVVLIRERNKVRVLEGRGKIDREELALRNRLAGNDIKYYELDYTERQGAPLEGYVAALNMFPDLLDSSNLIKEIS